MITLVIEKVVLICSSPKFKTSCCEHEFYQINNVTKQEIQNRFLLKISNDF